MAMTVGGMNPYVSTYNGISQSSQVTAQRIATGSDYPDAAQNAAGYAVDVRLSGNIGATSQSVQNTQNTGAMLKIAEGATDNTLQGLSTLKTRLLDAANDTDTAVDRQALQKEINQIVAQIDANAYVQYNGMTLLDGSRNGLTLSGSDGLTHFQTGDLRAQTLGLTDNNGNVTIDVSTVDAANASLKIVDSAATKAGEILDSMHFMQEYVIEGFSFDFVLDEATTQGAQLQRLEMQQANYVTTEENQIGAQSNSSDADIAAQVTAFKSRQIQEQLATLAINVFNHNQKNALNLLP